MSSSSSISTSLSFSSTSTSSPSSAPSPSSDPFQLHADLYAIARPTYPEEMIDKIVSSCGQRRRLAVDVGAGSGQLTFALAPHFEQVLAIDKSEAQLRQREEHRAATATASPEATPIKTTTNILFRKGLATDLTKIWETAEPQYPLADLVTCAQMYHWLVADGTAPDFLKQVQSILQRNDNNNNNAGRLAILGYSVPSVVNSPALQDAFREFYVDTLKSEQVFGTPGYMWSIDRRLVDSQYAGIDFPGFTVVERCTIPQVKSIPLSIFLAYMRSMSAYQLLHAQLTQDGGVDPMEQVQKRMYAIAKQESCNDDEEVDAGATLIQVQYPFFLILLQPNNT